MYERGKSMKMLMSLILILVMSLSAVSASASPAALEIFTVDGSKMKAVTGGVKFETQISRSSVALANSIVDGMPLRYVYLTDDAGVISDRREDGQRNVFCIAPLPSFDIDEDMTDDPVKFEISMGKFAADYLIEHLENKTLAVSLILWDGDAVYVYELKEISVVIKEAGAYDFAFSISLAVAKAAENKPLCLKFDIRAPKAA